MLGALASDSRVTIGYRTDYIWRGINVSERNAQDAGLFHASIDMARASGDGLTWLASIWTADFGDAKQRTRLYGSLAKKMGDYSTEIGVIRYDLSPDTGDTTELSFKVQRVFKGMRLGGAIYYDVDLNDGRLFSEAFISKDFSFEEGLNLNMNMGLSNTLRGYLDSYNSLALTLTLSKRFESGLVQRVFLTGEMTDGHATDGNDLFGGASLTFAF